MTIEQQCIAAAILCGGAFVQGTAGFGLGMFSIPLLVWNGFTLPQAIGATVPAVLFQSLLNCWQHRRELPWHEAFTMSVVRIAALPVGIWCLQFVARQDIEQVKQFIGVFLALALLSQGFGKASLGYAQLSRGWLILAGAASGFLAGLIGMGGPPLSLFVLAHDWPPVRQRSFMWLSFLLLMPFHTALLVTQFGPPLVQAMLLSVVAAPTTFAGALLGARCGGTLDRRKLRWVMLGLLWLIAVRSLVAPYFSAAP